VAKLDFPFAGLYQKLGNADRKNRSKSNLAKTMVNLVEMTRPAPGKRMRA
jgi:hypothetical protein